MFKYITLGSWLNKIIFILTLLSLVLFVFLMILYGKTLINVWYLIIIGLSTGIILGYLTYNKLKKYLFGKLKNHISSCVFIFGISINYLILWTNFNFPDNNAKTYDTRIIDSAMSNRRGSSIVTIEFAGIEKDLRLPIEDYDLIKRSNYVKIVVDKGLFGFYIIKDKKVSNKN